MNLEEQSLPRSNPEFPLSKISAEVFVENPTVNSSKPRNPIFDIRKWNIENNKKYDRLPKHSKNQERLHKALKLFGNADLEKCTLLDDAIYETHAKNFYRRLLRKFGKSLIKIELSNKKFKKFGKPKNAYFESPDHQRARTLISFITVIHSVEALDVDVALEKADELSREVEKYVSMVNGAACIGVLEAEVFSIKYSRRIRDLVHAKARNDILSTDEDGVITYCDKLKIYTKLNDCEMLSSHLTHEQINGESGQFIIHFHGILKVEKPEDIKELKRLFLTNPHWSRGKNQVLFKPFTEVWKEYKTIEESLKDFAYYFTKGGAVKQNANRYLQYKLNMPDGMKMSYEEYLNFSERNSDENLQILIEKGDIFDSPILSHHEINSLALVVKGMMNWNIKGNGYIVSVGNWGHH